RPIGTLAYLGGLQATLERFTWAWGQLVAYNYEYLCGPGEYVHLDKATVSLHDFARNSLVERFLGNWLMMLDADHAPHADLLGRRLPKSEQIKADVTSATYRRRAAPGPPVLYQWADDAATLVKPSADWDRDQEMSVLRVGSAGAGALLVKRTVYA